MTSAPPQIGLLPEHLIDQIKAGEVIERPGNLIKEILENAIDAGATKLELSVKNNGLDLIALKDNGHGMIGNDLPLAFSRHATSKIKQFEDLYHLHSFGFRGEALASIAAISRLQCITFNALEEDGSEIRIDGGLSSFHGSRLKTGNQTGTELVIQDLFFNTPARLKFIQSQQSEKQFIKKVIFAFILARPEIEFHIKFNDEDKEIFPGKGSLKDRLIDMLPRTKEDILYSQKFYEENEVEVFLIPGQYKAPIKFQNIYINDRYILDKQLHRVMSNALQANFERDDFHYIAKFKLPAANIDANVHPNKTIVKLLEVSKLISLLTATVKELAAPKKNVIVNSPTQTEEQAFPSLLMESPVLPQARHEYNMEGFFSPHSLPIEKNDSFIWIGNYFLKSFNQSWLAVSASSLLQLFIEDKIKTPSPGIPLLVSEPYSAKGIKSERIEELQNSGLELELLGSETLVLRSIPEWMNGFPLKEIVSKLLLNRGFQDIKINPADWSQRTWDEMIEHLGTEKLSREKITSDLQQLLKEKLK